jgi:hypothetical protein
MYRTNLFSIKIIQAVQPNNKNKISSLSPEEKVVSMVVYDILGRKVATLVSSLGEDRRLLMKWILMADLPSGVYYYILTAGDYLETKNGSNKIELLYIC